MARLSMGKLCFALSCIFGIGVVLLINVNQEQISTSMDTTTNPKLRSSVPFPRTSPNTSTFLNKVFSQTCNGTHILPNMPVNNLQMTTPVTSYPIVLLVTFNKFQYYETVPYIELLYRDYFENVLYCGPSKPPEYMIQTFQMNYILFEQNDYELGGAYIYNCTMQAINMNYDARGILYMSDDVLLKVESIRDFNMNEIWLSNYKYGHKEKRDLFTASYSDPVNGPQECHTNDLTLPCNFTTSHIQPFVFLKRQLLNVHAEILDKITLEIHEDKFFTNFLQALEERSGGKKRFFKTIVDIYYIPKNYWKQFNRLAEVFLRHKVYMELTVPNILHGLEILKDHPVTLLQARNVPRSQMIPIFFQNKDWYAWHPFKLGTMGHGDEDTIQAFCSLFHGHWYRNPQFIK